MSQFTLEKSRYFPYIAWTLIIMFTLFVGSLTLELRDAISKLGSVTQNATSNVTSPNNPAY